MFTDVVCDNKQLHLVVVHKLYAWKWTLSHSKSMQIQKPNSSDTDIYQEWVLFID